MVSVLVALCVALAIVSGVLAYVAWSLLSHQKDLLDRLMARDYASYAMLKPRQSEPPAPEPEPAEKPLLNTTLGGVW